MLPCDIVFSDLDGTLLDADHRLTARTIAAVAALRRAGVPFVPVSARGPSGVRPICRALDLGPGPMVACGGALVYGTAGECLTSTGMTVEAAAQAQALCAAHGAAACLYAGADWLAPNPEDPRVRREEEIVCARARRGGAQDLRPDARVHKVLAICTTSAQADALQAEARAALAACKVARSSPILVEIMARGVDKGAAVRRVCNHLGLAPARALAFGDGWNDLEMLEVVGLPCVMENAPEGLRARFPRRAQNNADDGVARAVEALLGQRK